MSDIYLSITETPAVVTLSQPVISGALSSTVTVANTVTVALDANSLSALENVTVTVGAAVSVSNFPSSQVVTGSVAVTTMPALSISSVTVSNLGLVPNSVATDGTADGTLNFVKIGGHQSGSNQTAHIVHVSAGGSMSVDATDSVVSISNFPSTQTVAGTVTANVVGYNSSSNQTGPLNLAFGQESFTDGSRIGVALIDNDGNEFGTNFPLSVAGTVTANLSSSNLNSVTIGIRGTVTVGNSVTIGSLPAISGTVTANIGNPSDFIGDGNITLHSLFEQGSLVVGAMPAISGTVTVGNSVTISSLPAISGTVTANIGNLGSYSLVDQAIAQGINNYGEQPLFSIPVINESGQSLAISGTVTANNPSGALTTRFGSVATANLAFITSAVTNTSRKYLLAQNISAGTVTIGIGFSPTTTQGIQLTAGGGLTFDAFCPTGAVYWLGAVTGAAFTILEG